MLCMYFEHFNLFIFDCLHNINNLYIFREMCSVFFQQTLC